MVHGCGLWTVSSDVPHNAPLQVLNLGHNKLAGDIKVRGLQSIRALILNDNKITTVAGQSAEVLAGRLGYESSV